MHFVNWIYIIRDIFLTTPSIIKRLRAMDSAISVCLFSDDIPWSSPPPEDTLNRVLTVSTTSTSLRVPRIPFDFNTATKSLAQYLGFTPYRDQVLALQHLYNGKDHILVAPCWWGKTIVITGPALYTLKPGTNHYLIVSPLKAIQLNQATSLREEIGDIFRPFVLDGETNTAENRRDIAIGKFTHVLISAEIAISDINTLKERGKKKQSERVGFPCGYLRSHSLFVCINHDIEIVVCNEPTERFREAVYCIHCMAPQSLN
jgi:ATP-dependent helicase YprA (DUF1998 family)